MMYYIDTEEGGKFLDAARRRGFKGLEKCMRFDDIMTALLYYCEKYRKAYVERKANQAEETIKLFLESAIKIIDVEIKYRDDLVNAVNKRDKNSLDITLCKQNTKDVGQKIIQNIQEDKDITELSEQLRGLKAEMERLEKERDSIKCVDYPYEEKL